MRTLINAYSRLLTWLMVATVAVLVFPVSLQVFSRYTALPKVSVSTCLQQPSS